MNIRGKTILITGAAERIGRAIALAIAKYGATILIHYNRSHTAAQALKREIQSMGYEAECLQADFSRKNFAKILRVFLEDLGRFHRPVDILINNASVFAPAPLETLSEKDWDSTLNINLKAPFLLAAELGKRMKARRSGKIINIVDSSLGRPPVRYLPYAVAKAGLHAATVGLARALAPYVQVNSIAPGPILPVRGASAKQNRLAAERTLLKKFGSPADIVAAVQFLVQGTDFVTGALIPVDGGSAVA
ncbi:MAG: SDR family NAD(P)-dependent oxidoreductase [Candidatus Omnitrophota bacterium]